NVDTISLPIGYTPSGSNSAVSDISGSVGVNIGNIAMDFSVWKCSAGHCSSVAGTTANQNTAAGSLNFQIDFGAIKTGTDLVINTPIGSVLRTIMTNGLTLL